MGATYIGGCCGTNAAYIKRLAEKIKGEARRPRKRVDNREHSTRKAGASDSSGFFAFFLQICAAARRLR